MCAAPGPPGQPLLVSWSVPGVAGSALTPARRVACREQPSAIEARIEARIEERIEERINAHKAATAAASKKAGAQDPKVAAAAARREELAALEAQEVCKVTEPGAEAEENL